MASDQHQIIAGLIVRFMCNMGYTEVCKFDGTIRDGYFSEYGMPCAIGRHRPDCISYNPSTKRFAIGEAKTSSDLIKDRTIEELIDFTNKCINDDDFEIVVFGFPKKSEHLANRIIGTLDHENQKRIKPFRYYEEIEDE